MLALRKLKEDVVGVSTDSLLMTQILYYIYSFHSWYVGQINREVNYATHRLVKAVIHQFKQVWIEDYPHVFI